MFEYVSKSEYQSSKKEVDNFIKEVHNLLRKEKIVTFRDEIIGSGKRHLITRIKNGNQGYDFDYNLVIMKFFDKKYENAKLLKKLFIKVFDKVFDDTYQSAEDSTSVFTIKKLNKSKSKILFSIDFAIVCYYIDANNDERQLYIRFDKNTNGYSWVHRPIATNHRYAEDFIKYNNLWNKFKDLYLERKNKEPNKKSRIVFYQTLETFYNKYSQ